MWLWSAAAVSATGILALWLTRPVNILISENPHYVLEWHSNELAIAGSVLVVGFLATLAVIVLRPVTSIHPLVPTIPLGLTLFLLLGIQLSN